MLGKLGIPGFQEEVTSELAWKDGTESWRMERWWRGVLGQEDLLCTAWGCRGHPQVSGVGDGA